MSKPGTAIITADEINGLHRKFLACGQRSAEAVFRAACAVGEALHAAKAACKPGGWHRWIRQNCEFTDETARTYMAVFERKEEIAEKLAKSNWEVSLQRLLGNTRAGSWTGKTEWYTPKEHVERVRQVLGEIDLDPATCKGAQRIIRAKQHYTQDDNGLEHQWAGRVFLNPPFKMPLVKDFTGKLVDSIESGDVTAAVLLTNNATDTDWWQRATKAASGICFTDGRICFYDDSGESTSPTNGQTFCYYGDDPKHFRSIFADVGICLKAL